MRSGSQGRGGEGRGMLLAAVRPGVRAAIGLAATCGVLSFPVQPAFAGLSPGPPAAQSSVSDGVGSGAGAAPAGADQSGRSQPNAEP